MRFEIVHALPGRVRAHLFLPDHAFGGKAGIEANFRGMPGVRAVSFSPRTGNLLLRYDPEVLDHGAVLREIGAARSQGTAAVLLPAPEGSPELERKKKAVIRSGVTLLAGPIIPLPLKPFLSLHGAWPILRKGLASLWHGRTDSSLLDAAAVGSAMASRDFLTASVISFLLKLGDFLEEWTRRRFRRQLTDMFRTGDEWVWVLADGQEARVRLDDVREQDIVVVRMGSLIPVDGTVVEGEALVNQSSLTGEGLPVMKREGKSVYAGTAVEEGMIHVRAVRVGKETRAARVVRSIEEAEPLKAKAQSEGERLADRLVPYSFLLSGLTYAMTGNTTRAASVLLVDYSCAIKLSTPLAILTGLARAARMSVLIKGGRILEKLSQADVFILDKTGTLTEAMPRVAEVVSFNGYAEDYILQQTACIEEHFPHPVAAAVVKYATERGLYHEEEEHAKVEYVLAHGITSWVHGRRVAVGSRHFIQDDEGIDVSASEPSLQSLAAKGYSALYVAVGRKLAGLVAIHDPLRDEARRFIERLKASGIRHIVMLTGDNAATAREVAGELGITEYHAQAFPETKLDVIKEWQQKGHIVAMVGDGINDSPALSHADVGISMRHGADIAKEACDVLLMEGTLEDIFQARRIATETLDTIKRNYRAIIGLNSSAILMAMSGQVPPIFSAVVHNLSTIGVSLLALKPMRGSTNSDLPAAGSRKGRIIAIRQ